MTIREFIEDFKVNPKFWVLLVLYTVLTPIWGFIAYIIWHRDKITAVVAVVLCLYCGMQALFKWTDV
jgi:hypothetical protein